jgi:hypothetical protein
VFFLFTHHIVTQHHVTKPGLNEIPENFLSPCVEFERLTSPQFCPNIVHEIEANDPMRPDTTRLIDQGEFSTLFGRVEQFYSERPTLLRMTNPPPSRSDRQRCQARPAVHHHQSHIPDAVEFRDSGSSHEASETTFVHIFHVSSPGEPVSRLQRSHQRQGQSKNRPPSDSLRRRILSPWFSESALLRHLSRKSWVLESDSLRFGARNDREETAQGLRMNDNRLPCGMRRLRCASGRSSGTRPGALRSTECASMDMSLCWERLQRFRSRGHFFA